MTENTETKKATTTRKTAAKKPTTLTEALLAFQADLPKVTLDGKNPHFKSQFSTLSNTTSTVLPRLNEFGLAYSVQPTVTESGFILRAELRHESGETLEATFPIKATDPQKVGSEITYYRRYALAALTGVVADEDDDGNTASSNTPPTATSRKIEQAKATAPATPGGTNWKGKIKAEIIDNDQDSRDADDVNALVEKVKKDTKKSGDALYEDVYKRLKAGEVAA